MNKQAWQHRQQMMSFPNETVYVVDVDHDEQADPEQETLLEDLTDIDSWLWDTPVDMD